MSRNAKPLHDLLHEHCLRTASTAAAPAPLALRYALRELRGGLRGFYVFIGLYRARRDGDRRRRLGRGEPQRGTGARGPHAARRRCSPSSLFQREAKPDEVAFLAFARTRYRSRRPCAAWRAPADGRLALVEMKAVDAAYPMLGELTLDPKLPVADLLAERDGAFGAAADPTLLARLDLEDRRPRHDRQRDLPDPQRRRAPSRTSSPAASASVRASWSAKPRLRATGLLQPGSLVRWIYRVKLPDNARDDRAATALIDDARAALPEAGWEIRSRANASPQLERTISRFTQFLTLVGLAALLVGGVGVANAVKSHIDRRRDVIAAFKALGATGRDVFRDLSDAGGRAGRDRLADRACRRRGAALRHRRPVRQAAAAAGGAGAASGRTRAVVRLRPPDRAGLRTVAARPGA